MRVLSNNMFKQKAFVFALGLVLALTGMVGVGTLSTSKVLASCTNDIMCNGFSGKSDFITTVKRNSDNGHTDLKAIYGHQFVAGQDLTESWYDDFAAHAVAGWAYRNSNTITLDDGTVVATGARSIGRDKAVQGPNPVPYQVGSKTFWGNYNDKAFASGSDRLRAWLLLDGQGQLQFAVLASCGNPVFGNPKPSSAKCTDLQGTPVTGKLNTYGFRASTNVTGNAKLTRLVYSFGDGSKSVTVSSNFGQTVQHSYKQAGTYTASVTVYVSIPGYGEIPLAQVSLCKKVIVIPSYFCSSLTPTPIDASKFKYRFVAKASYTPNQGVVFTGSDYNFGDNTAVQFVRSADGKTTTVDHTFAKNGDYNISALLHFTVNGVPATASFKCTASTQASTCKPGIPVGDVRCNPCPTNPAVSADDTVNCVAPQTELPNTGAGNTIAIFAAVVVAGFLGYRHVLFRRHRAAYLAAQHGVSPLPLGDPLDDEAPLTGTPLTPKKRTFRRRQF